MYMVKFDFDLAVIFARLLSILWRVLYEHNLKGENKQQQLRR